MTAQAKVVLVLLAGLVSALAVWAVAREMTLPRWGALTAAGATVIAVSGLGIAILTYLSSVPPG